MNELSTETFDTASLVDNPSLILFDPVRMRALDDFAKGMAESIITLPKHLQGKPSDCKAITLQAMRWRMDPYVVASKTNVINGNLGYEAQLVVAVLKTSGAVKGRPHYEYKGAGQQLECRAGFVPAGEDEIVWTEWLMLSSIKVKNSPLWATNPPQQFGYLQARNWARLYAPEALLGVYTTDELQLADTAPKGPRRKSETPLVERVDGDGVIHAEAETKQVTAAAPAASPAPAPAKSPAPAANGQAGGISGNQVAYLRNKLKASGVSEQSICDRFQVTSIELLSPEQFDEVKSELLAMA